MGDYSTKQISPKLISDICENLQNLDYGSLELYVTEGEVTQITKKNIKKTNGFGKNGNGKINGYQK